MNRDELQQDVNRVIGRVGIHGLLALVHDRFGKNPGQYATYPVIQAELRKFDLSLRETLKVVSDPIDEEVCREFEEAAFKQYGVVPLYERY